MNKLSIIGNLTRDPELRTTPAGISVCSFTVAVNRRRKSQNAGTQPETDFFRVTAWRQLGEMCHQYLAKGKKVYVIGPVSVQTYQAADGQTRASLEITAEDVEFLSPRSDDGHITQMDSEKTGITQSTGFTEVIEDDLPF